MKFRRESILPEWCVEPLNELLAPWRGKFDAEWVESYVQAGQLDLWTSGDQGFALLRIDESGNFQTLVVWALWTRDAKGQWKAAIKQLFEWARVWGCKFIEFVSTRKGWERSGKALGAEAAYSVTGYIAEV